MPNWEALHLTALISAPRSTRSLFPYTTHHPRCLQIDYLVTLGCEVDGPSSGADASSSTSIPVVTPSTKIADSAEEGASQGVGKREAQGKKRVLTAALSAHLYILPHHRTSILYISKLDSSGYPTIPLPLTRTFITSILQYFIQPESRPTEHVRIQLFARSQGQYLFPNSAEGPKKILGGLGLCGWWKGVYEDVAARAKDAGEVRLGMVLPGYSPDEAKGMLGQRKPLLAGLQWTSAQPFSTPFPPLAGPSSTPLTSSQPTPTDAPIPASSLASLIPSFPDDPKSRFLDDLVCDGAEDPQRRRRLLEENPSSSSIASKSSATGTGSGGKRERTTSHKGRMQLEDEAERRFTQATLEKTSKEEYWERMGFRQECISGDVTGFFTLESTASAPASVSSLSTFKPIEPTSDNTSAPPQTDHAALPTVTTNLPPDIVDRLVRALLNTDFKTLDQAIDHTAIWDRAVHSVVIDEIGEKGYQACIAIILAKEGGEKEVEMPIKRKEEVTMLQPRKKKKAV